MPTIDWDQLLRDRPDVLAEYQDESTRDHKSRMNLLQQGVLTPQDFAEWWYNRYGAASGYQQAPQQNPATQPPATPNPAPNAGDTPAARNTAMYRAINNARLAVTGRGLTWEDYDDDILRQIGSIYDTIPENDVNPMAYFDPNLADTVLNGLQNRARINYRNQINSSLGTPGLDYSALDASISRILGENVQESEEFLERGLKRGQFNEQGVTSGRSKLEQAKLKAQAKLKNYASDIFNSKTSMFDDIYDRALSAANNYTLGDTFNMDRFTGEYGRLRDSIMGSLEGELYDLADDEPLINLTDIRGAVGKGQGAVNLRDLDVIDGLAKRKKASEVGRGLGSQGAF